MITVNVGQQLRVMWAIHLSKAESGVDALSCQQLCQHVQQWVLRFSKFSDNKLCRLSSEIKDDTIANRLDDAILDGSDVDDLLRDRIKRRDVFMSIVMSLLWEHIFTRYLFGLDQSQRQKLKSVEKQLVEIGMSRLSNNIAIRLTSSRTTSSSCSMACNNINSAVSARSIPATALCRYWGCCSRNLSHSQKASLTTKTSRRPNYPVSS